MALKAPGILIFTLSLVLSLAVLFSRFFGASVPYLTGDTTLFYAMWGAYLVLLLGCVMRGLQRAPSARPHAAVPICRAAFGALEKLLCGALYFAMEKHSGK